MNDEVLSCTAKADGVPCGMDNGQNVGGDDQPPSQPEVELKQVSEDEPDLPRTRASNLSGVRGQPVKQRKMASDMAAFLDRFCEATRGIEELKLEVAIKMQEDNRKLELKMFKSTQTSQERMTNIFANVLQGLKK
jgi:hypothetical protein